ncbi:MULTISPECIES: hypothetical protein [unclassified Streptomyces]
MAALRNLSIDRLRLLGAAGIAKPTWAIRDEHEHAAGIWGSTGIPTLRGT